MSFRQSLHDRLAVLRQRLAPEPGRPMRRWARERWLSLCLLALAILAVAGFDAWLGTCGFEGCPSTADIRAFRPAEGGKIFDRGGRLMGRVTDVHRINVPLAEVPRHVREAFIATEDRRFYEHSGLDWRGFGRALVRNVAAGGVREGFSTITMQVARNTFAANRYGARTLRRKLMELRLSRLIEQSLTKDQILELYLNVIYLGNGAYGVEAASRDLFGKHVKELSVAEGAMLAALPKGPSAYTPRRHHDRALQRRNLVLGLMAREGYLTRDRAAAASRTPLHVADEELRLPRAGDSYALDAVRALVDSVVPDDYQGGDLRVYTTLDAAAQRSAERSVARHAAEMGSAVQGALIALDPRTGDIRAIVGGRRYERGGFDRALAARRQPGSAFKPFVYAAALQVGFSPASEVDDDPVQLVQGNRIWRPANYGDEYEGRVTFRRALMHSLNAATIRVSRSVGESRVIQVARRNGITSPLAPVPSIALGTLEVTPIELVTAYAPFANGGYRVTPRLVRRIEAGDGTVIWASEEKSPVPVMDPRDAYELTSMLRGVVDYGTGHALRDWGVRGAVAGKTGTTNSGTDVWFVGYTPTLVAGVWFGYDSPRPLEGGSASGGRYAAPAWADFYLNGWREERGADSLWAPPPGMVPVTIDPETGYLANEWCPSRQQAWFRPGTEPTEPCPVHSAPEWDQPTVDAGEVWVGHTVEGIGKKIQKAFQKIFKF